MTDRVKVACINWGTAPHLEGAPKATAYVLRGGEAIATSYHDTWAEAMARADFLADLIERSGHGSVERIWTGER